MNSNKKTNLPDTAFQLDCVNIIKTNAIVETVPYGETVIPQNRLQFLIDKCKETLKKYPGNILEVGVYRGGTLLPLALILKDICPQFKAYGIDTFSGHPYSDNHPVHPRGKYSDVDIEILRKFIVAKQMESFITLFQGRVEDIFDKVKIENISFAHIDCDLYIPTKFAAEEIPKVLNENPLMYFDDYGHEHCPGATKAVNEAFDRMKLQMVYIPEDNTCWSCFVELNKK